MVLTVYEALAVCECLTDSVQYIVTSLFKEKLFVNSVEAFGFHFVTLSAPQNIAVKGYNSWCLMNWTGAKRQAALLPCHFSLSGVSAGSRITYFLTQY